MSSYDCKNLRIDADFEVPISHNVFWVPVNVLGGTRYTNEEMSRLVSLKPEEKKQAIQTLYEAVQLFLHSNFKEELDVVFTQDQEFRWEHHKPGYYAVLDNSGCCASTASWLNYVLEGKYPQEGYFAFVRPISSGHVYNYFYQNGWFYLYDLFPMTDKNVDTAIVESGNKADYFKAKYISGILIKCKTLEDYVRYFRRIMLRGGYEHIFFEYKTREVPPIASQKKDSIKVIYFPSGTDVVCLEGEKLKTFDYKLIDVDFSGVTWEELKSRVDEEKEEVE